MEKIRTKNFLPEKDKKKNQNSLPVNDQFNHVKIATLVDHPNIYHKLVKNLNK